MTLYHPNKTGIAPKTLSYEDSVRLHYDHLVFQRTHQLSLLEFGNGSCRECIKMEAVIDSIDLEFSGIVFLDKINLREKTNRKTAAVFDINMIPSQVILDRRGELLFTHTGFLAYDSLKTIILDHLKSCP
ncbi:MAG: hypothetical protein C0592_07720 [Marinilabiliales bacterium]|nr:MAG: hypothetical protein C0592_07720 [Marinilabiliales bacterium]